LQKKASKRQAKRNDLLVHLPVMLKKVFCFFFLFVFTFNVLARLFPFIEYKLNKEFIAKNLCENRNKPQMKCEGKCHLQKQLQKTAGNETQGKTENKDKVEDVIFTSVKKINFSDETAQAFYRVKVSSYSHTAFSAIFHPPCRA
jgi:hypothetical protein